MNKIDKILKEFYGQYGLVMHTVQILENGMLEFYALKKFVIQSLTKLEYYEILSNKKKLTLGQINQRIFNEGFINEDNFKELKKANKIRIFLAHRFWWDRNIEFDNIEYLIKLHNELISYLDILNNQINMIDVKIQDIRIAFKLNIEKEMGLTDFNARNDFINKLNN